MKTGREKTKKKITRIKLRNKYKKKREGKRKGNNTAPKNNGDFDARK